MATSVQVKWPQVKRVPNCQRLTCKKVKNSHGIFSLYSMSTINQGTSLSIHLTLNANTVFFIKTFL